MDDHKKSPKLRLLKAEDIEPKKTLEPKSQLGKELTRFADELDKEIERLLNS